MSPPELTKRDIVDIRRPRPGAAAPPPPKPPPPPPRPVRAAMLTVILIGIQRVEIDIDLHPVLGIFLFRRCRHFPARERSALGADAEHAGADRAALGFHPSREPVILERLDGDFLADGSPAFPHRRARPLHRPRFLPRQPRRCGVIFSDELPPCFTSLSAGNGRIAGIPARRLAIGPIFKSAIFNRRKTHAIRLARGSLDHKFLVLHRHACHEIAIMPKRFPAVADGVDRGTSSSFNSSATARIFLRALAMYFGSVSKSTRP